MIYFNLYKYIRVFFIYKLLLKSFIEYLKKLLNYPTRVRGFKNRNKI